MVLRYLLLALFLGQLTGWGSDAHWAYRPLSAVAAPDPISPSRGRNPVDQFIAARLAEARVKPAQEADPRTLLRRVYYNLVGLPPTPEEMSGFLSDPSRGAYEKVVDRLLASPRYGERWARHWMDVAHFAETHGHDQDRIRTNAWPYRDYLIQSFNADKSFPRFVQEQVAGDVLFPEDPQAIVALGFLAAGPWDESSLRDIREDTLDRQAARYLDRDDTVGTVMATFTSSTVQCARCHDHKFDPIPQADYYALQAVFAGVDRASRRYDPDPAVHRTRRLLLARRAAMERGETNWVFSTTNQLAFAGWVDAERRRQETWKAFEPQTFTASDGSLLKHAGEGRIVAGGPRPERDTYTLTGAAPGDRLTAVRIEVLTHTNFPHLGPGRQENGNFELDELQVTWFPVGETNGQVIRLEPLSADFEQAGRGIAQAVDGNPKTGWGIFPQVGQPHEAIFRLNPPVDATPGGHLTVVARQLYGEGHLMGHFRISFSGLENPKELVALSQELKSFLAASASDRAITNASQLAGFARYQVNRDLAALPKPSLVYAAAAEFEPDAGHKPAGKPRPVHVLRRGEITRPLELARPGALELVAVLPPRFNLPNPDDEGARRAALARWLTDPENALVWRSIVNRIWHFHFGQGLVETPNDFGKMGGRPSHPELLDWLARWFRDEAHGSFKALHRLLVTSAVYRQATVNPDRTVLERDAENRWLSHMNRTRLDAEQVRDAILQITGRLDLRMGGPSDYQFAIEAGPHVTPKVDYSRFEPDSPLGQRRSVYRFLFRSLPDPLMDALDCPAGDQLTPVRNASVTVQQALALWNSAFVTRSAEHFAHRLEREAAGLPAQIELAFALALNRPPVQRERTEFVRYAERHGLSNFCRLLLNSNEFMFVN